MYPTITDVKPISNYLLIITFKNGEKKKFDMKPYLDLMGFAELKDPELFKTVRVNFDCISWDNDADLDPEILYNEGKSIE